MKTLMKWGGGLLLLLAGIAAAGYAHYALGRARIWDVAGSAFAIPESAEAIAHGEHLARSRGCTDCHGQDFGGAVFAEDGFVGRIVAPNLTRGGLAAHYEAADYDRGIRHGVGRDGRTLLVMPADDYAPMSDEDLGAIVAFLRAAPPVDRELPAMAVGVPVSIVHGLAGNVSQVAQRIDHLAERKPAPPPGETAEYGRYVGAVCAGCHRHDFRGGAVPGGPPDWPVSADLTAAGRLKDWSDAQFISTLRTGNTPDGRSLHPMAMPWSSMGRMSDMELKAIWLYLRSLPAS